MKKLNKFRTEDIISKDLNFINSYKEYLYLLSEDESTDKLDYIFYINRKNTFKEIEEKNYSFEDRIKVVLNFCNTVQTDFNDFGICEKNLIMISNSKFHFFPRTRINKKEIKKILPDVIKFRNCCSVYFSKNEINSDILKQFFIIPFLFSYQDVYIIPYFGNTFFSINHHLDIFEIKYIKKME